jgi:low temperature requirement protein LtrA
VASDVINRRFLRPRSGSEERVTPIELFFDLVFVFAVTQLSHRLLEHLTLGGAAETLLLLLAVWVAWTYMTWVVNWFNPELFAVRAMLVAAAFGSLVLAASIPGALGARGLGFAGAFVAMHIGRPLFALAALRDAQKEALTANFQRVLVWACVSAPLWLAGAFAEHDMRISLWLLAVALDLAAPMHGFAVPRLGRTATRELRVEGGHLAHRYSLFVLIALGESILAIGTAFSALPASSARIAALVVAFVTTVSLWEIYFERSEESGHEAMTATDDAAHLGHWAYIVFHLPMVAGIIVLAAGEQLAVEHPTDPTTTATIALLVGGVGLYLVGNALFNWMLTKRVTASRLVPILALGALVPFATVISTLAVSIAAAAIVVAVAVLDMRPD